MNRSKTVPGKVIPMPFPAVKTDVEEQVISYLEQKGTAKNDYDRALDFFLDLDSDFGVEDNRR